jgi:hypothetical protein
MDLQPLSLEPHQLADFFVYLFEKKKLAPITIKGYRSAIARVYRLNGNPDPGADQYLSLLMDNFSLERPTTHRISLNGLYRWCFNSWQVQRLILWRPLIWQN